MARDLRNRTRGVIAAARRRFRPGRPDDVVLEERVHTALGRVVSHQHAITVKVQEGHVILDGPLSAAEATRVVAAVHAIPGVRDVETRFDSHIQPAREPSDQSARAGLKTPPRPDILQRNWAPATRAIALGSGAALVCAGVMRRDRVGIGLAWTGMALGARAVTNLPFRRLVGAGSRHDRARPVEPARRRPEEPVG